MKTPDVTGFLLDDAREVLKGWNSNIEIREVETKSPKDKNEFPVEEVRVIKQKNDENTVFLTIAYF